MFNLFTRPAAMALGLSSFDVDQAARCCALHVERGLYSVWRRCPRSNHAQLSAFVDDPGWMATVAQAGTSRKGSPVYAAFRSGVHLARASVLDGRDVTISHRTAALVHGLPLIGGVPTRLELIHPVRGRRTPHRHVRARHMPANHTMRQPGYRSPATTGARTVVDLARDIGVEAGLVAADAWLDTRIPTSTARRRELDAVVATVGRTHRERIDTVAAWATGLAESPAESRAVYAIRALGIGPIRQQVPHHLPDGTHARVDIQVGDVVIEVDGWSKYDVKDHSFALADLKREKRREDGLRALGLRVVRIEWKDCDEPGAIPGKLAGAGLIR